MNLCFLTSMPSEEHSDIPPFLLQEADSVNITKSLFWVKMWFEHISLGHLHNSATRRRWPILVSHEYSLVCFVQFLEVWRFYHFHKGSSFFSSSLPRYGDICIFETYTCQQIVLPSKSLNGMPELLVFRSAIVSWIFYDFSTCNSFFNTDQV